MKNVYKLTASDYDAFGAPGDNNFFSESIDPQNYVPALLESWYSLAGDAEHTIVYKYNTDTDNGVVVLADQYSKEKGGAWTSSYSFITEIVEPYKMSSSGWVYDPTVIFTMSSEDFQMVVDHSSKMKYNTHAYPDNSDNYYGASSYYTNFDIENDGSWNKEVFGSWDEAV